MAEDIKLEDFALRKKSVKKGSLSLIGVVGCGAMGQEIVRNISQNGFDVNFVDISQEVVQESMEAIAVSLDKKIANWGLTQGEKKAILNRINGSTDYKTLENCDLVIEAINTVKKGTSIYQRQEVFKKVEESVDEKAVIVSNTSTLMISELSSILTHPERTLGMHFISPVDNINIVEVVRHASTTDEAYDLVSRFVRMINKKLIEVHESPGNISTRMTVPMINEACDILMEGVATVYDIDQTMRSAFGNQYGPFELADKIGLDKLLKWMDNLYLEFGEQKYKASPVIKRLVRSNHLGRKTQVGFYKYVNNQATEEAVTCAQIN
ncbi:MAG: 3-hydroxyacyl-CoA dehydrogenase family protein [Bacteroidales bacterium]|nr:3-hydroxyacyl-CoA dehydrogenase family protein [Bacteroidales bacterium]